MEKIEKIEEKKEIIKTLYYGDYIEELEKRDIKYYNKLMNETMLLKTDDNFIIRIDLKKPTIDSTLWFDDEQPIPELTEKLFISYNMHNFRDIREEYRQVKTFLYDPYYKSENPYKVVMCSQHGYNTDIIRTLTDDEEKEILKINDELKENYAKRLKSYYKRYFNKISCNGYWVNR